MSEVLDKVRDKFPAYKDVTDEELAFRLGNAYPQYLDSDSSFKTEFESAVAGKAISMAKEGSSALISILSNPAAGEAAKEGRRQVEKESLAKQTEQARAEAKNNAVMTGFAEAGERIVGTVAEMNPPNLLKRTLELPAQIAGSPYKLAPAISEATARKAIDFLDPVSYDTLGSAREGVKQALSGLVSGITSPDQVAALLLGVKEPEAVARLFQVEMGSQVVPGVKQLVSAVKTGDKTQVAKALTDVSFNAAMAGGIEAHMRLPKAKTDLEVKADQIEPVAPLTAAAVKEQAEGVIFTQNNAPRLITEVLTEKASATPVDASEPKSATLTPKTVETPQEASKAQQGEAKTEPVEDLQAQLDEEMGQDAETEEKGTENAIQRQTETPVRDVQQSGGPEKGSDQVPADETGKEIGQGSGEVPQKAPELSPKAKEFEKLTPKQQVARIKKDAADHRKKQEKSSRENLKLAGKSGGVEMVNATGDIDRKTERILITPSTSEAGKWQATRLFGDEPYGHQVFDSREAAIRAYSGESFSDMVKGPSYSRIGEYKVSRVIGAEDRALSTGQAPQIAEATRAKPRAAGPNSKRFQAETEQVGQDLMSFINENGGIMSWSDFSRKKKSDPNTFNQNKSEYDDIQGHRFPIHHNVGIYGGKTLPNVMAEMAFKAGLIKDAKPSSLWERIKADSQTRQGLKKGQGKAAATLSGDEQMTVWNDATKQGEGRTQVNPEMSVVGDSYEIDGQKVAVASRDENTGTLTLDGGEKFGQLKVKQSEPFYADKVFESEVAKEGAGSDWNVGQEAPAEVAKTPEPEKPAGVKPALEPKTKVEERALTKAEQDEFQDLSIKARRAREEGGEPLTTDETKRYDELSAMSGQFELLGEDSPSGIRSRISQLKEKVEQLERLRVRTQERAFDSKHRRNELFKEAVTYDNEAKKAREEISKLEQQLPKEEQANPETKPEDAKAESKVSAPKLPDGVEPQAGAKGLVPTKPNNGDVVWLTHPDSGKLFPAKYVGKTGESFDGNRLEKWVWLDGPEKGVEDTGYGRSFWKPEKTPEEPGVYGNPQEQVKEPDPVTPQTSPTAITEPSQKYRVKNTGPQTYTLVERLPATEVEIANGEQPVRVKNEKTGAESVVLESDLQPVKERTAEERAASKGISKKDLDDELRRLGMDPGSFNTMSQKREAIRRAKLKGPGSPSVYQGPDPKAQIEQLEESFRNIKGKKVPFAEKIRQAFDLGEKLAAGKDAVSRAVAGLKSTGDYLIKQWEGYNTLDELLKAKGDLSAELERRGWSVRKFVRSVRKAIPDKKQRAAIAKWVDAGGDQNELHWGSMQTSPEYRQAYVDAMNLSGDSLVAAENIRNFFDSRLQEAIDAGVLEDGVSDYIHRLYEKDPKAAQQMSAYAQSGILSRNPALAKKRIFQLDWEAERLGFRPVQDFLPRLTAYETSLSRAIAARNFVKKAIGFTDENGNKVKGLIASDGRPVIDVAGIGIPIEDEAGIREVTLINPSFKPGDTKNPLNDRSDYKERPEYSALRKWKWATTDGEGKPIYVQGNVVIHKDYAERIDALLKPSSLRFTENKVKRGIFRAAIGISSTVKQTMLDFSGFHQVQIAVHALEHRVNPLNLEKDIDFSNPDVDGLLKGGTTLGGEYRESHAGEGLVGRSLSRLIPGVSELMQTYHEYLFQDFIPRIKMTMALHALERNRSRFAKEIASGKMSQEEIFHLTSNQSNAAFGELNYITLERSKTAQDLSRLILLAPDFLEARGRFAAQAFTKHGTEQRTALLLGALTMYTAARVINQLVDGQPHLEPENLFSVVYKNKSYSLRTVQGDLLHLIEKPVQFWMSRLNPVYGRTLMEMATGRDYFGRKRSALEQVWDAASTMMPVSLRSSQERKLWESLVNGMGVTARRYNDTDEAFKLAQKWKDKNGVGMKGEFIYDSNKDPLRPLKLALSNSDDAGAVKEIKNLVDSKKMSVGKLNEYFSRYAAMPFTGSQQNDRKFYQTLDADQKKTFDAAKEHKKSLRKLYQQARDKYSAALHSKPEADPDAVEQAPAGKETDADSETQKAMQSIP